MSGLRLTQPPAAPGRAARDLYIGLAKLGITAVASSLFGCGGETSGSGVTTAGAGATGGLYGTGTGGKTSTGGTSSLGGVSATGGTGGTASSSGGTCPGGIRTLGPLPASSCTLSIPNHAVGFNVLYTNSASANPQTLPNNPGCSLGDGSGWTSDDPLSIRLCPSTCKQLEADPSSQLALTCVSWVGSP